MYLIVLTSRPKSIDSNNYIVNKRGLVVSTRYGFGLMDAGRMVEQAQAWTNVPKLNSCQSFRDFILSNSTLNQIEANLYTNACFNTSNEVNFIEQVEIKVSIRTDIRGQLEIYLTSPSGTKSLILSVINFLN
jgi:hypothetical protein